jgi:hypothetical protein
MKTPKSLVIPEKKKRLTAAQAREIAGTTVSEKVDALLERIHDFAERKKRSIKIGRDDCPDTDFWVQGAYKDNDDFHQAKRELEALGYSVNFWYEEKQFVDMFLEISW